MKMKKLIFKTFAFLITILMLFIISCGVVNPPKVTVFVKGSRSMSYVFKQISDEYIKSGKSIKKLSLPEIIYGIKPKDKDKMNIPRFDRSRIEFIFLEGGSGRGLASLLDGNKDGELILSTRDFKPDEIRTIENINKTYIGNIIYQFKYAEDDIIPIVNVENRVDSISVDEISAILKGNTKNWSSVYPQTQGTEFFSSEGLRVDNAIQIAVREKSSGLSFYLLTRVTSGLFTTNLLEIASDKQTLLYVARIYNSISFVSSVYKNDDFIYINKGPDNAKGGPSEMTGRIKELSITKAEYSLGEIKTETTSDGDNSSTIEYLPKIIVNTKPHPEPENFFRRNCNIIFMKNQKTSKAVKTLRDDRNITMDDVLLDFINFAGSAKGRNIGDKYYNKKE